MYHMFDVANEQLNSFKFEETNIVYVYFKFENFYFN